MDLNNLIEKIRYFYEVSLAYEVERDGNISETPTSLELYREYIILRKEIREMISSMGLLNSRVGKDSGKPFKSTLKINTVKSITKNSNSGKPAFTFHEDDSVVDIEQCYIIK